MKKKKYKMIFEVICNFDDLIDEETFKKEYKGDLTKLCKWMYKNEGMWFDEELKFKKAIFIK